SDEFADAEPPPPNPPFSATAPGVPTAVSLRAPGPIVDSPVSAENANVRNLETPARGSEQRVALSTAAIGGALAPRAPASLTTSSAGQLANVASDVLVAELGVDPRRVGVLVAGDPLCEVQVPLGALDVGQRGVPQHVEVEPPIEPGPRLPLVEQVAQSARRDPLAEAGDEQRGGGVEALTPGALPLDELAELVPGAVGQEHVLVRGGVGRPLERP